MQVNTNIPALVAANAINLATQQAAQASQRLSTSMRVNSSADDPGLMSVLNSTKAKIASWSKANDNISSSSAMLSSMNTRNCVDTNGNRYWQSTNCKFIQRDHGQTRRYQCARHTSQRPKPQHYSCGYQRHHPNRQGHLHHLQLPNHRRRYAKCHGQPIGLQYQHVHR